MIALLLLGFAGIALIQIPSLVHKQWWWELIVFTIFWLSGLILSVLLSLGVKLPPVTTIIGNYISKIFSI